MPGPLHPQQVDSSGVSALSRSVAAVFLPLPSPSFAPSLARSRLVTFPYKYVLRINHPSHRGTDGPSRPRYLMGGGEGDGEQETTMQQDGQSAAAVAAVAMEKKA